MFYFMEHRFELNLILSISYVSVIKTVDYIQFRVINGEFIVNIISFVNFHLKSCFFKINGIRTYIETALFSNHDTDTVWLSSKCVCIITILVTTGF